MNSTCKLTLWYLYAALSGSVLGFGTSVMDLPLWAFILVMLCVTNDALYYFFVHDWIYS